MIVLSTPIIPGDEDSSTVPVLTVHDCVNLLSHEILRRLYRRWWVVGRITGRNDPGYIGHVPRLHIFDELVGVVDIVR